MKKRTLSLLCVIALIAGMVTYASAEDSGISVQLDGKSLTFSDATPTAKDGRTYLPARVVLEALGATVTADSAAGTVTAVRDGKTLVMTIGSTEAAVTEDGVSSAVFMDAAPYVENSRTYVPVRFAAQAFSCAVGYDGSKQTVVLVDTEKLVEDALADHKYTLMEKAAAFTAKYNTGAWAVDGTATMNMGGMGVKSIVDMTATVKGIVADQTAVQMNMDMKMDMTGTAELIATMTGKQPTAQELAAMKMALSMDIRMDLAGNKYYMMPSGLPTEVGFPKDTWFSMDMNSILAQAGIALDTADLLKSQTPDVAGLASTFLAQMNVDDSTISYGMCALLAQKAASIFADDAFTKTATGYINKINLDLDGLSLLLTVTLTTNATGDVTAYQVEGSFNEDLKVMVTKPGGEKLKPMLDSLAASGLTIDKISMDLSIAINSNGTSSAKINMDMGDLINLSTEANLKLSSTTKKPETTPPAGATVIDFMKLMNSMSAQK